MGALHDQRPVDETGGEQNGGAPADDQHGKQNDRSAISSRRRANVLDVDSDEEQAAGTGHAADNARDGRQGNDERRRPEIDAIGQALQGVGHVGHEHGAEGQSEQQRQPRAADLTENPDAEDRSGKVSQHYLPCNPPIAVA